MTRVAAILTCLALAGCVAAAARQPQVVAPGAPVTLAPGETATIGGTSTRVRFLSVTEDSRCPRDTTCIWAGEVTVSIEIREASKQPTRVQMKEGGSAEAGQWRLTLVSVEPHPMTTVTIAAGQYRVTLETDART
jgi:hypothetical protein